MNRFIFLSFAFLGWAFYEVSGGPDFQPRISAALAATESAIQESSARQTQIEAPQMSVAQTVTPPEETSLIVADDPSAGNGVTTYSLSDSAVPSGRKLVFSLPATAASPEIRRVRADNVNMRTGPGTQFVVVDNLPIDTRVKLLDGSVRGWVKLRSLDSGRVGWIQSRYISAFTS